MDAIEAYGLHAMRITAVASSELGELDAEPPAPCARLAPENPEAVFASFVSAAQERRNGPCGNVVLDAALHLDQWRILESFLKEARDPVQTSSEGTVDLDSAPHRTFPS